MEDDGESKGVVNKSKPELIGRALVPFFLGEDDVLNEQLAIPDDQELFRSYIPYLMSEAHCHILSLQRRSHFAGTKLLSRCENLKMAITNQL